MEPKLSFVELAVTDWPRAVAWYTKVLHLPLLLRDEANGFALLAAGAGRLALKVGEARPGTTLMTFEVADLPKALHWLQERGVAVEEGLKGSSEGYHRVIIRDPDGHRICLFAWNDPSLADDAISED